MVISLIPNAAFPRLDEVSVQTVGLEKLSVNNVSPMSERRSGVAVTSWVGLGVLVGVGGNHRIVGVKDGTGDEVFVGSTGGVVLGKQLHRTNPNITRIANCFIVLP
jgi:hypothetical protein